MLKRPEQSYKTPFPRVDRDVGRLILDRSLQKPKTYSPIEMTLVGMMMLESLKQLEKT